MKQICDFRVYRMWLMDKLDSMNASLCVMKLWMIIALMTSVLTAQAQTYPPKDTPQLEFALQLRVQIDSPYTVGETPHGRRVVIPITGGTFEGPQLRGTILSGGADYQLVSTDGTRTELEAIYSIQTDDGVNIHVRNRGMVLDDKSSYYFKTAPQFEAPSDSKYAWLNNAIFVCQPDFSQSFKGIILNVWKVK